MTNKQKHTVTPWTQWKPSLNGDGLSTIYSDDARYPLAMGLREANAKLIVKAVNSHEGLVEACKEVLYWLKKGAEPDLKEVAERKLSKALKQVVEKENAEPAA